MTATTSEADTQEGASRSFAKTVLGIAGTVRDRSDGGGMNRGERAELRRMREDELFPPEPFWRLVERYDIRESQEPFWIDLVPLMVDHPHTSELSPGLALARSGVSGARIERWLRLDRARARKEAGRLLARLEKGLNWIHFAGLLRFWTNRDRRQFARNYFLSDAYRRRQESKQREEDR